MGRGPNFRQRAVLGCAQRTWVAPSRQSLAPQRAAKSQLRLLRFEAWLCSADAPGEQRASDCGPCDARCGECGAALPAVPPGPGLDSPSSGQDPGDGGSPTATSSPASGRSQPDEIRRLRVDQSSRFLSNGCSSPSLPRRRGARLSATATPPGEIERSTDGGASWKRIVRTGSAPIVRMGARAKRRSVHHWRYTRELRSPIHGLCQ